MMTCQKQSDIKTVTPKRILTRGRANNQNCVGFMRVVSRKMNQQTINRRSQRTIVHGLTLCLRKATAMPLQQGRLAQVREVKKVYTHTLHPPPDRPQGTGRQTTTQSSHCVRTNNRRRLPTDVGGIKREKLSLLNRGA